MNNIHENPRCPHNGLPVTPARVLWVRGDRPAALQAIQDAKQMSNLSTLDRFSLDLHELVLCGSLGVGDETLFDQLRDKQDWLLERDHDDYALELSLITIELAIKLERWDVAQEWLAEFMLRHGNSQLAVSNFWLLQARLARPHGPARAWPYFELALATQPVIATPCARESFARQAISSLLKLGKRDKAREVIASAGVPVRAENGPGEGLTLEELALDAAL